MVPSPAKLLHEVMRETLQAVDRGKDSSDAIAQGTGDSGGLAGRGNEHRLQQQR
jgi:hypothetical protein